jgi:hypothetical protein
VHACTHIDSQAQWQKHVIQLTTAEAGGAAGSSNRRNSGTGKHNRRESKRGTEAAPTNQVAFLLCGAWVDDKVVVTVDVGLCENWFFPVLNERSITNDEGVPALLLGFDTLCLRPSAWNPEDLAYVGNRKIRNETQPLEDIFKHVAMHPKLT